MTASAKAGYASVPAPTKVPCPLGELRLEIVGSPAAQTILSLDARGGIELALAPGKATFELEPAGCLAFQGKLVAEMLPDGRILSVTGEPIGALSGRTLTLRHSTIAIGEDGQVTQTPSPGLPPERFVGLEGNSTCAAAMLIVALGESVSGASMAVVDGVATRLPPAPAPPGSKCAHVPR